MARRRPLGRKLFRSILPILVVVLFSVVIAIAWLVYGVTRPLRQPYLVTPQGFQQISGPVLVVTDETWSNRDSTKARGWLLRGTEGAPAIVLLHRYGADRSWVFNLAVKLHETTNFTILCLDLRGHGVNPLVQWTSFGSREGDDVLAALDYLRGLKAPGGRTLVGDRMGLYGIELGGCAALRAALRDTRVRALALDSVPGSPDELLLAAVKSTRGIDNRASQTLARIGIRAYFLGRYDNTSSCQLAAPLSSQRVLLLSGEDAGYLRNSTTSLGRCFPAPANVEVKTDLPLTGYQQPSATGEQGEGYDRLVIEFFDRTLRAGPAQTAP